jgi:predicted permease
VLDVLIDVIVPVVLVAAIGGFVGRTMGFSAPTLSNTVFYLFSPALVFTSMSSIDLGGDVVGPVVAVAVIVFFVNLAVALGWAALRRSDPSTRAIGAISAAVANQGNMGVPMARLAFGSTGLDIAVILIVVSVLLWSSVGIAVGTLAMGGTTGWGALFGIAVNLTGLDLPTFLDESLGTLAEASIPTMLVVLGLQFRLPQMHDLTEPLASSANRLLVGPLVAFPLAVAFGLEGAARGTSVMLAGMPTAVVTTIIAAQLGAKVEDAVRTVVVSTLLSMATLTVLITVLR